MFFGLALLLSISSAFSKNIIEGEWIKKRKSEYRYVTTFDIIKVKRPLKNFPWIEEDCHDNGNRFANWSRNMSYDITYSGSVNFGLLGFLDIDLGAERSKTVEFNFQRWVTPTLGIKAKHVLHEEYEVWQGETRREYRDGDSTYMGNKSYPFKLEKINYGISVVRNIESYCD
jgi:hypothetical protein